MTNKKTWKQHIWKILSLTTWIISAYISLRMDVWEVNAKPGFGELVYHAGLFLGILIGIFATKAAYSARSENNNQRIKI